MKNKITTVLALSAILAAQACNSSANNDSATDTLSGDSITTDSSMMMADTVAIDTGKNPALFMEKAAIGGMMEIEAGKIAQQNAKDAKVKDFAAMMIKDHTATAIELSTLAKSKKIVLPAALPDMEKTHLEELKGMTGADFDKHYMGMMVKDHKKTVDLFKSAKEGADQDVSAFATKTLKTLETHYKLAQDINGVLKAN